MNIQIGAACAEANTPIRERLDHVLVDLVIKQKVKLPLFMYLDRTPFGYQEMVQLLLSAALTAFR